MPIDSVSSPPSSSTQQTPGMQKIIAGVQSGEIKTEDVQKAAQTLQQKGVGENTNVIA